MGAVDKCTNCNFALRALSNLVANKPMGPAAKGCGAAKPHPKHKHWACATLETRCGFEERVSKESDLFNIECTFGHAFGFLVFEMNHTLT